MTGLPDWQFQRFGKVNVIYVKPLCLKTDEKFEELKFKKQTSVNLQRSLHFKLREVQNQTQSPEQSLHSNLIILILVILK